MNERLESYLNGLTKLGWNKAFGHEWSEVHVEPNNTIQLIGKKFTFRMNIITLLSLESGFWQFVCEKGLVAKGIDINNEYGHIISQHYSVMTPEYRLMLSSIQPDKVKFLQDSLLPLTPKE